MPAPGPADINVVMAIHFPLSCSWQPLPVAARAGEEEGRMTEAAFLFSRFWKHRVNLETFKMPGDESERREYPVQRIHLKTSDFIVYLLPPLSLNCSSTELHFWLLGEGSANTARAFQNCVCARALVCWLTLWNIYIKLLDCANWKKKIGQFYQTWGNKCWERADGRQDFHVGEFLLAGPVWVVVPICPDAPIHFLGPLWCQKMNGLCIWSLVINSWIRSIAWTDMNQGERRGGGEEMFSQQSVTCKRLHFLSL